MTNSWNPKCGHKAFDDYCGPCNSFVPEMSQKEWDDYMFEEDIKRQRIGNWKDEE